MPYSKSISSSLFFKLKYPSPPTERKCFTPRVYMRSKSNGSPPTLISSAVTRYSGGKDVWTFTENPEGTQNLPSRAGYLLYPFIAASSRSYPEMRIFSIMSWVGSILLRFLTVKFPAGTVQSSLIVPAWIIAKSDYVVKRRMSASKFPIGVSWHRTTPNSASRSCGTLKSTYFPASSIDAKYLSTIDAISGSGSRSFVRNTFSQVIQIPLRNIGSFLMNETSILVISLKSEPLLMIGQSSTTSEKDIWSCPPRIRSTSAAYYASTLSSGDLIWVSAIII